MVDDQREMCSHGQEGVVAKDQRQRGLSPVATLLTDWESRDGGRPAPFGAHPTGQPGNQIPGPEPHTVTLPPSLAASISQRQGLEGWVRRGRGPT